MAQIVIDIPNAVQARVLDAFSREYGRPDTVPNPAFNPALPVDPTTNPQTIPNPETKGAFAKKQVARFIREVVQASEAKVAAEAARVAALNTAATDTTAIS